MISGLDNKPVKELIVLRATGNIQYSPVTMNSCVGKKRSLLHCWKSAGIFIASKGRLHT